MVIELLVATPPHARLGVAHLDGLKAIKAHPSGCIYPGSVIFIHLKNGGLFPTTQMRVVNEMEKVIAEKASADIGRGERKQV